jgi:hypothetical protein
MEYPRGNCFGLWFYLPLYLKSEVPDVAITEQKAPIRIRNISPWMIDVYTIYYTYLWHQTGPTPIPRKLMRILIRYSGLHESSLGVT